MEIVTFMDVFSPKRVGIKPFKTLLNTDKISENIQISFT